MAQFEVGQRDEVRCFWGARIETVEAPGQEEGVLEEVVVEVVVD